MLPVVILCGGLATRLYPVTLTIPKPLIEIDGKPFIHHQLKLLKEKGVKKVFLCTGYLSEMIEDYVDDGSLWGLDIEYSYDGDTLLGTGGAIKKLTNILPESFLVLYGDSYLNIDFEYVVKCFYSYDFPVLMTIYKNKNKFDISNIAVSNGKVIRYDKRTPDITLNYIDYGLIALQRKIFEKCPSNEPFDLSLLLSRMVDLGQVAALEIYNRFYEIGSIQGIKETETYIRNCTFR